MGEDSVAVTGEERGRGEKIGNMSMISVQSRAGKGDSEVLLNLQNPYAFQSTKPKDEQKLFTLWDISAEESEKRKIGASLKVDGYKTSKSLRLVHGIWDLTVAQAVDEINNKIKTIKPPSHVRLPQFRRGVNTHLVELVLPPYTSFASKKSEFFRLLGLADEVVDLSEWGNGFRGYMNDTEEAVVLGGEIAMQSTWTLGQGVPEGHYLADEEEEKIRKTLKEGTMSTGVFPFIVLTSVNAPPGEFLHEIEVDFPIRSLPQAASSATVLLAGLLKKAELPEKLLRCEVAAGSKEIHLYGDRSVVGPQDRELEVVLQLNAETLAYLSLEDSAGTKSFSLEARDEESVQDGKVELSVGKPKPIASGNWLQTYQPYAITVEGDRVVHNVMAYVERDGNMHAWPQPFKADYSVLRLMFKKDDFTDLVFENDVVVKTVFLVE